MKHIFVFMDKIMYLLKYVPPHIKTEDDARRAKKAVTLIEEYAHILKKLLEAHRNDKHLKKLHSLHVNEVDDWASHVEDVFKKSDELLDILDTNIAKLNTILAQDPAKWHDAIPDFSWDMVMNGLREEEGVMKHLRNAAIFEIHELEQLISHKGHLQGLHKWVTFLSMSDAQQIVEHKKYFTELLK